MFRRVYYIYPSTCIYVQYSPNHTNQKTERRHMLRIVHVNQIGDKQYPNYAVLQDYQISILYLSPHHFYNYEILT